VRNAQDAIGYVYLDQIPFAQFERHLRSRCVVAGTASISDSLETIRYASL